MNLTIQLTAEDYVQATRLHMRPRPFLKWVGYFLVLLAVSVSGVSFGFAVAGRDSFFPSFFIMAMLAYLWFVFVVLHSRRVRKIFSQQKSMQVPYSWNVTDEGIHAKSEISEERLPWNHFIRWKEGKSLFIIYQSDVIMRMIPKRCFASSEQMGEFRQLLQTKLGPAKV